VVSWTFVTTFSCNKKTTSDGLSSDERVSTISLAVSKRCWIVTDERTRGQKEIWRQHIPRYAYSIMPINMNIMFEF